MLILQLIYAYITINLCWYSNYVLEWCRNMYTLLKFFIDYVNVLSYLWVKSGGREWKTFAFGKIKASWTLLWYYMKKNNPDKNNIPLLGIIQMYQFVAIIYISEKKILQ